MRERERGIWIEVYIERDGREEGERGWEREGESEIDIEREGWERE